MRLRPQAPPGGTPPKTDGPTAPKETSAPASKTPVDKTPAAETLRRAHDAVELASRAAIVADTKAPEIAIAIAETQSARKTTIGWVIDAMKYRTNPAIHDLANSDHLSIGETASWATGTMTASTATTVANVLAGARATFGMLASIATGVEQYALTTAQTRTGKIVDAALGGAVDMVFGMVLPEVALLDGALNFLLPKLAPHVKQQAGQFVSGSLGTAVRGAVTVVEAVLTGNYKGVHDFDARAKSGEYGIVFKGLEKTARAVNDARPTIEDYGQWINPQ
jgi:hypothetical protein